MCSWMNQMHFIYMYIKIDTVNSVFNTGLVYSHARQTVYKLCTWEDVEYNELLQIYCFHSMHSQPVWSSG